jgi:hypothetical protein
MDRGTIVLPRVPDALRRLGMSLRPHAVGLLLLVAARGSLAEDSTAMEVRSLAGLPPVVVEVRVDAPTTAGIGEQDLKTLVEARLRQGGIGGAVGLLDYLNAPRIFVSVGAPTGSGGLTSFGVGISVSQYLYPLRTKDLPAPKLLMSTWNKVQMSLMDRNGYPVFSTRYFVEKLIDQLAGDYAKANSAGYLSQFPDMRRPAPSSK